MSNRYAIYECPDSLEYVVRDTQQELDVYSYRFFGDAVQRRIQLENDLNIPTLKELLS